MKLTNVEKHILFDVEDDRITHIWLQSSFMDNFIIYQIKFAIRENKDHDKWFLITSLDPLQVFGGLAGVFIQTQMSILMKEEEIIQEILKWDVNKLMEMADNAKWVQKYTDLYT